MWRGLVLSYHKEGIVLVTYNSPPVTHCKKLRQFGASKVFKMEKSNNHKTLDFRSNKSGCVSFFFENRIKLNYRK